MNILVTGGAGYIGSILITELVKSHTIKCLDRFFFGNEYLSSKQFANKVELIRDDIRWFDEKVLKDVDAVIDLAALSNDPTGELAPKLTDDINHLGRVRVAKLSKKSGVKRYILGSSASVYGFQKNMVDETAKVDPLTAYAKANRLAEIDVLPLDDKNFTVTVLRFGTIYGISPRMRFDLAVNIMTYNLFKTGKIIINGDGKQSRPFLHVKDASKAYQQVLESPANKIGGQIFNIGSEDQNYQIVDLAKEIGDAVGKKYSIEHQGTNDHRSYLASFKKITETIGFKTNFSVSDGALEIYRALESGELTYSNKTITLEWYKHLLSSNPPPKDILLRDTIL